MVRSEAAICAAVKTVVAAARQKTAEKGLNSALGNLCAELIRTCVILTRRNCAPLLRQAESNIWLSAAEPHKCRVAFFNNAGGYNFF